jgi:DNA (cytosine-5)-methyltransferase 1
MMAPSIGSVCTGYGGLDMAVRQVFGGELAWVSDIDPGACRIIAHRMPGVPNIGDLTTTRWEEIEPVDIFIGGYPCQPFSLAGELKGTDDDRHLWPFIAGALRVLRPRIAIFENVANHLRIGFDTVLCDLADIGFDAEWCVVRADEVGASHQRRRLIFLATATDAPRAGRKGEGVRGPAAERGVAAADAPDLGYERGRRARGGRPGSADGHCAAADAQGVGRGEGRTEPTGQQGRLGAPFSGGATPTDTSGSCRTDRSVGRPELQRIAEPGASRGVGEWRGPEGTDKSGGSAAVMAWGQYAPAVTRWEAVTGRRAPWATDDRNRLSPAFVEWMMGLPAGHVTDVPGLSRTNQLKALGNGVVPQQAAAAIRLLADRAGVA